MIKFLIFTFPFLQKKKNQVENKIMSEPARPYAWFFIEAKGNPTNAASTLLAQLRKHFGGALDAGNVVVAPHPTENRSLVLVNGLPQDKLTELVRMVQDRVAIDGQQVGPTKLVQALTPTPDKGYATHLAIEPLYLRLLLEKHMLSPIFAVLAIFAAVTFSVIGMHLKTVVAWPFLTLAVALVALAAYIMFATKVTRIPTPRQHDFHQALDDDRRLNHLEEGVMRSCISWYTSAHTDPFRAGGGLCTVEDYQTPPPHSTAVPT